MTEKLVGIQLTPATIGPRLRPNIVGSVRRSEAGPHCPADAQFKMNAAVSWLTGYYKIVDNQLFYFGLQREWKCTIEQYPTGFLTEIEFVQIVDEATDGI